MYALCNKLIGADELKQTLKTMNYVENCMAMKKQPFALPYANPTLLHSHRYQYPN